MTGALVASHLTKVIGDRTIVDDVSFDLRPGEVFGFLGPNGAGKTTTIRMLVGLIKPTQGTVTVCGYDLRRNFEKALRCIGCIVENPDLYRFMSGRENLEHFARMLGVPRSEIERVAALVNLAHRLDQRVGTYSLGMRQRLGIAQAMLGQPRVLILDEPANGLDPAGIREIRELLRGLAAECGMAVFVSSHLLAEIELTADRVAIIHKGRILRSGTVRELISSNRVMEFRVGDVERASSILREQEVAFTTQDDLLLTSIDEADAPPLIAALAGSGVGVFHARPRVQSLEEMFLEATGGETVD
ncbi:MAG: type transport system ATP-binding protein [Acidobacteriota bacterium]|jgi:ABC-2 type transport system ATP-binding protein|nr:type transport system ATP-binding protein [Acidobacteriota bacterium]